VYDFLGIKLILNARKEARKSAETGCLCDFILVLPALFDSHSFLRLRRSRSKQSMNRKNNQ
jgi:hypothetical protein